MNRDDFIKGLKVRRIGTRREMVLGGTRDAWECRWTEGTQEKSEPCEPEQLERVPDRGREPAG